MNASLIALIVALLIAAPILIVDEYLRDRQERRTSRKEADDV